MDFVESAKDIPCFIVSFKDQIVMIEVKHRSDYLQLKPLKEGQGDM